MSIISVIMDKKPSLCRKCQFSAWNAEDDKPWCTLTFIYMVSNNLPPPEWCPILEINEFTAPNAVERKDGE
jgi:hypothetical protein